MKYNGKSQGFTENGRSQERHAQHHAARAEEIWRQEAPTLVKELIRLATSAEGEAVCVAAIKEGV